MALSLSLTYRYYPLFQSQPFSPPLHSRTRSQSACVLTLILDTPISPHVTDPPTTNSSLIAIRRNIYSKQFNASFMLTIKPLSRQMILSTSHIKLTPRVVSSSCNVLSYHLHQLTSPSQSSLLSASPSPNVSTSKHHHLLACLPPNDSSKHRRVYIF